jgi:hypothetical protein
MNIAYFTPRILATSGGISGTGPNGSAIFLTNSAISLVSSSGGLEPLEGEENSTDEHETG